MTDKETADFLFGLEEEEDNEKFFWAFLKEAGIWPELKDKIREEYFGEDMKKVKCEGCLHPGF